jgi:hypothetical protein
MRSALAAGEFSKKKIRRVGSLSGHDPVTSLIR